MEKRKQSITTISFQSERAESRGYYERTSPAPPRKEKVIPEEQISRDLLELCHEIAGALIRRYLVADDPTEVRREVSAGLQQRLDCTEKQAYALITLGLELIHVKSYGYYRCTPTRLSKLIQEAGGAKR